MKKTYLLIALLLFSISASAQFPYCDSGFDTDPTFEFISRVRLNTLDNTSATVPPSGYTSFTGLTATDLVQSSMYTIIIDKVFDPGFPQGLGVWIDFNQDDDFDDPGEFIYNDGPNEITPSSGNFTVPLTALTGNTRMRIQMRYNGLPLAADSCDEAATGLDFGEVEDYTVNIVGVVLPPDIEVSGNAIEIPDGSVNAPVVADNTDFGNGTIGAGGITRTFVIENTGNTTDLTLTGPNPVSLGVGSDAAFTITTQPSDLVLASGESTSFTVTYTPTVAGLVLGEIIIANDDPDTAEQTFSYNISGIGVVPVPSPGNVSTNLQLWMKANVGTALTGTDVDSWVDQSPNGFSAVSEGSTDAQLVTDGLNFNPVLRFAGTDFLNLGNQPALDLQPLTDEMTIITMVITNNASTGTVICKGNNNIRNYQVWFGTTDRVLHHTLGRTGGAAANQGVRWGTIYALNEPKLTTGVVSDTGDPFTRLTPYMNGVLDPADFNVGVLSGDANVDVLIGARRNGSGNTGSGYRFDGDIAEIIIYDRDLTAVELQKVESYLALKYGITLGSNDAFWDSGSNTATPFGYAGTSNDYMDSSGNTIWNGATNAGFGYNVFGIARDDNSQLMQIQSKSVNIAPADVLTIRKETGVFDSNLSYLIVGNNGLAETIQTTTLPVRTLGMLNKIWTARESSVDVGTVELEFDMSASGIVNLDDLELYIADGTTFAAYENYQGTNVGGVLTFTGVNLSDGQFFTLAEPQTISGNNALFFDGVDDFVEDNTPATQGLTDYTVMGWVKNPGQVSTISDRRILGVTGQYKFFLNSGLLGFQEGQTGNIGQTGSGGITDWVHFAIINDVSSGRANFYLNGRLAGGGGIDPLASNTNPFRMGTQFGVNFFTGSIDEVRIFDTALTLDQLREMVHQEIEQNGANVRGKIIPKDIEDFTTGDNVPWASLIAYHDMSSIEGNRIADVTGNGNTLFMKNITSLEPQTAPMPYMSVADGNWEDDATWEFGSVWDTPSASSINWSIVQIRNNVTASASYSTLGLTVDAGATLTVTGTNPVINSTSPFSATSGVGYELANIWYTELNGIIDLNGESQFRQSERSDLAVTSSGYLEKDQQGTASQFTYNFWGSPVSAINTTANNQVYTLGDVLLDGTIVSTPSAITWTTDALGATTSPFTISTHWIYKYVNGADEDYDAWQFVRNTGNISPGEGYTMKGVSSVLDEREDQNYVFRGKPNNGVITVSPLDDTNLYLLGNPYPSVLDADEFINDNFTVNGVTTGTLYFWEHWGGGTHDLLDYQGGYAMYTLSGGTQGMSHPSVNQTGSGDKTPGQFISVGQGFFVQGDSNAGNGVTATVEFNNSQRSFTREYVSDFTVFVRDAGDDQGMFENPENATSESDTVETENNSDDILWHQEFGIRRDTRKKIRLGYINPAGFHRYLLLTFDRKATDAVDGSYDGESIDTAEDDMYWSLESGQYIIQAVENLYDEREVALGLTAKEAGGGIITLDGLENIDSSVGIYIKDNYSGATHDLRASNFQVSIPAGQTNDKYSLVFEPENPLSVNEQLLENGITMYTDTETREIVITNNTSFKLENIDMHTILGQQILSVNEGMNENTIRIPIADKASGIYIISINSEKGKISKKLVIQ